MPRLHARFIKEPLTARFEQWLSARVVRARRQTLGQRSVYIFPTRQGLMFGGLCGLLLLVAINYQNSLIYFLAFLLGSLFVVTILETYRNLAGLTVEGLRGEPAFAGDGAVFHIVLHSDRDRAGLLVGFPGEQRLHVDVRGMQPTTLPITALAARRGRFRPGRLLVETFHPLTLLRCWAWLDVDLEILVYPRSRMAPLPAATGADEAHAAAVVDAAGREFHGLREYRPGDGQRHVAWRRYAATGVLAVKQFARGGSGGKLWLRFETAPASGLEQRLSTLSGWVVQAARHDVEYGLELPGVRLLPDSGEAHRLRCLEALALFAPGSPP